MQAQFSEVFPIKILMFLLAVTGAMLAPATVLADDSANASTPSAAAASCSTGPVDTPLAKEPGSAGVMYNLAEHPKSIRAVAARLLDDALKQTAAGSPASRCPDCKTDALTHVVYRVGPTKFLPDNEQLAVCKSLAEQTRKKPFTYPDRGFKDLREMNEWVQALSAGRGAEGRDLYERCSNNCSPRYEFEITPAKENLKVITRVECGLARDQNDDDYAVSTTLRTVCPKHPAH